MNLPNPDTFLKDWHKAMTIELIDRLETARLAGATIYGIADDGSIHKVGDRDQKPAYTCPPDRYCWIQHPAEAPVAWYVFADSEHWITMDEDEAASNRSQGFQVRPLTFQDTIRPDPQVTALRADAERYRWLRRGLANNRLMPDSVAQAFADAISANDATLFDKAIDAALEGS